MKKKIWIAAIVMGVLLGACAPVEAPAEAVAEAPAEVQVEAPVVVGDAALTLTGGENVWSWTEEDLRALPQTATEFTDKDGVTTAYTGVTFADLLAAAGVSYYASLTLIAADEYAVDMAAEDISGCEGCLIAFQDKGGLRSVMPGFPGNRQLRDLVVIEIK